MYRLHSLPEVVANRVPPVPPTGRRSSGAAARRRADWLAGELGRLLILDAATGEPAGSCGLRTTTSRRPAQAMIGYACCRTGAAGGYATRAVRLLAGWAFGAAGMARLIAGTRPENLASQRVLERVGFRREGAAARPAARAGRHPPRRPDLRRCSPDRPCR